MKSPLQLEKEVTPRKGRVRIQLSAAEIVDQYLMPRRVILESGCWDSTFWKGKEKYTKLKSHSVSYTAHRLSFAAFNGPIPEGLSVLHRCDFGRCWNPDHLFVGTQADNIKDMDEKGRRKSWHPFGDSNPAKRPDVRVKISKAKYEHYSKLRGNH
jgi:hypothetical protein